MRSLILVVGVAACVETREPITGTQSLKVDLQSPTGTPASPLPDTMRSVVVDVTAIDADGKVDSSYNNQVQVYVNFLGTLTPYLGAPTPLALINMTAGVATNQTINLPPVFGPATLWFDDGKDVEPTYATGVSSTLWYRDPYIEDIQRPLDEMRLDALRASPLELKQVTVRSSKFGANGRLVVTSVFAQGYTVSDMSCSAGGAPPCTTGAYDHVEVFSFSAARDQSFRLIKEGQVIDGFGGGVSEFNGLTEIGFPQSFDSDTVDVDPAREPAPVKIDTTWFTNRILFERNEAAPIEVDGGTVCPLDKDYDKYKQWKIDPAGGCGATANAINVITAGVVNVDPATLVGKVVPRAVGVLRPVNGNGFDIWIMYPRSSADLTLP